jgi:hypothetical protein
MNTSNEQHDFGKRAGELLRASADEMDGATRARLARARAAALEPTSRVSRWFDFRYLAPAGALAAAVLATVLFIGHGESGTVNDSSGTALYDMELLADTDALDIAQETDLDFIEWAAAQSEQGGG